MNDPIALAMPAKDYSGVATAAVAFLGLIALILLGIFLTLVVLL